MRGSLRVLLLTLPVLSHDYSYSMENIPLAAGYLKGFAEEAGIRGPQATVYTRPFFW